METDEPKQLQEQVTALQEELRGEKIVKERLTTYIDKLLKEYAELEREVDYLTWVRTVN